MRLRVFDDFLWFLVSARGERTLPPSVVDVLDPLRAQF